MPTFTIDGQPVTVLLSSTVLQAIRSSGAHLPTLRYGEGLPPYGVCRLCLVEMTAPQQQVIEACAYPVEDSMVIDTQGVRASAIRRMILEFMLARCPTSELGRDHDRSRTAISGSAASKRVTLPP